MVLHPEDMSCSAQLCLNEQGLNAADLCWFKDFDVSDKIPPVNFQDGAEAALTEMLKDPYVSMVSDPGLGTVQKWSQHYSFINIDFGVIF